MFINNNDEDETVRQTLERIMREKGLHQEQQVLHTEIGDFSYYPNSSNNSTLAENMASNASLGNSNADNNTNNSLNTAQSGYEAAVAAGSWLTPTTQEATQSTPFTQSQSSVSQAVSSYAPSATAQSSEPIALEQLSKNNYMFQQQNQSSAPWDNSATQNTSTPWQNNQTVTPWSGGYDLSNYTSSSKNQTQQPYIFSEDMRNRLGELESGNDYTKVNLDGGGIGALGKYQIRRDGFKDAGYINSKNQWAGKNNINSMDDYLNNSKLQEQALDDFMKAKYNQLQNNGSRQYLGYSVKGIVDNFDITDTGLLAASHREGAGAVHNYLNHLEKDENGQYFIDYNKIPDLRERERLKRIETRLRKFEK